MADPSGLQRIFVNAEERRPRAPWRIGLAVALLALFGGVGLVLASALSALEEGAASPAGVAIAGTVRRVVPLVAFTGGLLATGWLVDRRGIGDLGLDGSKPWWVDLAFGLALGLALPGVVFGMELAAGYVSVTGTFEHRSNAILPVGNGVSTWLALALTAAYFVGVGVFEELLFRGYLLTNLAEGLDGWAGIETRGALAGAAVLTSLLFGLAHGSNPNATALASVVIGLFGLLLAASYLLTGRIAVPIGLHVGWNVAVSSVFGFPVSGVPTPRTVVAVDQSGPALVTGGAFGPEGGLVSLVALAGGALALAWWVRRREGRPLTLDPSIATPDLRSDRSEPPTEAATNDAEMTNAKTTEAATDEGANRDR